MRTLLVSWLVRSDHYYSNYIIILVNKILLPRGHLIITVGHTSKRKARNIAKYPTRHRTAATAGNCLAHMSVVLRVRSPELVGIETEVPGVEAMCVGSHRKQQS